MCEHKLYIFILVCVSFTVCVYQKHTVYVYAAIASCFEWRQQWHRRRRPLLLRHHDAVSTNLDIYMMTTAAAEPKLISYY